MAHKGAGEECDASLRYGLVAEIPHAAIEGVQEVGTSGDDPDRQSTAQDFAVGGEISLDPEHGLSATGMNAKSGDDLIEHQRGTRLGGNLAQLGQELARLDIGPPALHGLN